MMGLIRRWRRWRHRRYWLREAVREMSKPDHSINWHYVSAVAAVFDGDVAPLPQAKVVD